MSTEPEGKNDNRNEDQTPGISRRDCLKASALALGGLPLAGLAAAAAVRPAARRPQPETNVEQATAAQRVPEPGNCYPSRYRPDRYTYFDKLKPFTPGTPLGTEEMRITFMGSMIPPSLRKTQQEMSVFVEVGWVVDPATGKGRAEDQFVFDCGSGIITNYIAMGVGYDRMDKIFVCHLHGDHMNDLTHIYTFGPSLGRYTPLYVWGPGPSNLVYKDPVNTSYGLFDDGLTTYCQMLRAACRWHSESFSFLNTNLTGYTKPTDWGIAVPDPVKDPRAPYDPRYEETDYIDPINSGYAMVPVELPWDQTGVAYNNTTTRAKITHFPVVHCRRGSIGYKLEWTTPSGRVLSMIYTSDTRPESISIEQASNDGKGVDVFVHEMVVPPDVWAFKNMGLNAPPSPDDTQLYNSYLAGTQIAQTVQDSSHTPQGAFGHLLSRISPRPRLTVATHFPVADDTVNCAFNSVYAHCPDIGKLGEKVTWSFDLMVISVTADAIRQMRGKVSDYAWAPPSAHPGNLDVPRYWKWKTDDNGNIILDEHGNPIPVSDPTAQIDTTNVIPPTNDDGTVNYREDGY